MNLQTEINHFLDTFDRSPSTLVAYRNALAQFVRIVGDDAELDTQTYIKFLAVFKNHSPSTQRVYRTAVLKLYVFCKAGDWMELKEATDHYTHRPGKRIINFNREAVESVIAYCATLHGNGSTSPSINLADLRDRAFVLTLADTGLRISEACALTRGDVDWQEHHAVIIGKGDKQAMIYFSNRSIEALKDYLRSRGSVEPNSRSPLATQPLFARHDIRASKHVCPITSSGMWKAVKARMTEAGVDHHLVRIHDFRHYFVTMTYLAKKDLKLSQELARHESIATTNRYTHFAGDADRAYDEIFNPAHGQNPTP